MKNIINFNFINEKLSSGLKLRFDIGLSYHMPNTLEWLKEYDDIFVISIEPHPKNFNSCKNILNDSDFKDRCYLIECAIDNVDEPTKKIFYGLNGSDTNNDPGTSSLKKPKGNFENCIEEIYNVDSISLKYILDRLNYTTVEYIKTDTQGNDLNVLKSLKEHIKNVIEVQSEYDVSSHYSHANTGEELDNFLSSNNFSKYQPVCFYYQDESKNWRYQIVDYKYANTEHLSIYYYLNDTYIPITNETKKHNWGTWGDYLYELHLIQKFTSYMTEDSNVLDIGSQSGSFSIAAKFFPNSKWYSFEPDPYNYSLLKENLKRNQVKNVELINSALSNSVKEESLQICVSQRGLNTLGKNLVRFSLDDCEQCSVKVNTIDNLFLNTKIDLIKIDTEGSEYDIIKGGIETIKKYKPKILLEYQEENLNQCGYTIKDLNDLIEEIGYEIFWSDNDYNVFIQSKK